MKAIIRISSLQACILFSLFLCTVAGAQTKDSVADPALVLTPKGKHVFSDYLPYVLFAVVAAGLAYIAYRYFTDHSPEPDDEINPE